MARFVALSLLAALIVLATQVQARYYNQAELDALLAPIALHPDPLLSHVLIAATYPDDLHDVVAWSRANAQLAGEDAVRAADSMPWHPSVRALLAFPDLLNRMDESPQWIADLGAAFLAQEPQVMDTVQGLRRRAQATGYLQPSEHFSVQQQGQAIAIYPVQPQVIYVPYYDPYVVYGPWWVYSYRPVYWRPWYPRPAVFVSVNFFSGSLDWHRRHITYLASRQVAVQQAQPATICERPTIQIKQIPSPPQHPIQYRAEAPRPVAVQQPSHQALESRPPVQGGHFPQTRQGHQHRGGRG